MHDNARAPASGDPRISVVIVGRDGIQSLRPILSCLQSRRSPTGWR